MMRFVMIFWYMYGIISITSSSTNLLPSSG